VDLEGRKIARTFWGEAWCDHLESFSDYENRLPRGRTYVRNGSVCHLDIAKGEVNAIVSGSELYKVKIAIKTLPQKKWIDVKDRCAGQVGSLLELLQGKLSKSVMAVVTNRNKGLFPLPREISLKCNCPDWAAMCKHVAAVLYGVGARLDMKPELLFLLRGVDHEELISTDAGAMAAATAGRKGSQTNNSRQKGVRLKKSTCEEKTADCSERSVLHWERRCEVAYEVRYVAGAVRKTFRCKRAIHRQLGKESGDASFSAAYPQSLERREGADKAESLAAT